MISRVDYEKKIEENAKKVFQNHQLIYSNGEHWRLKEPHSSFYSCDIVTMSNIGLAVWGDINACIFANYHGNPGGIVNWVATMSVDAYAREKATIGLGAHELVEKFVPEVALYDIYEHRKTIHEDYTEEKWERIKNRYNDAYENAIECINIEENTYQWKCELLDALMDLDNDCWEWIKDIGLVTTPRVIYALSAVKRLNELL